MRRALQLVFATSAGAEKHMAFSNRKRKHPIGKEKKKTPSNPNIQFIKFCRDQKQELRNLAHKFFLKFNDELKKQTGRKYVQFPKDDDRYRLLTYRTWMLKYKVSLSFIVEHVVKYWIKKNRDRLKANIGTGTTIATMTGEVSEIILLQAISQQFPNNEHTQEWKSREQNKMVDVEIMTDWSENHEDDSPKSFLEAYAKRVERKQRQLDFDLSRKKFTKHTYRDNPWM